jgi:leucyl aminopeptidase (aminopeptidase T)
MLETYLLSLNESGEDLILRKECLMYPLELIQSIRLITDVCLNVTLGENVLCIADREENMEILTLIAAECEAKGAEVAVVLIGPRKHHHHEPPRSVAKAMQEADIVIAMTFGSLVHTQARKEATSIGAKFALMGEVTKDYLMNFNLTREDLLKVRTQTEEIARRLTLASSAHLTTETGTELFMSLEGRKGVALVPFASKGSFFGIPGYAEAACPPIEDSVNGTAVVDGTMLGATDFEELVEEPFEIQFEKGRIVRISGGKSANRLKSVLQSLGKEAQTFGELGVNSNYMASKKLRGSRLDMAVGGHVHLGLGRNDHIGGDSRGEAHLDVLVTWPRLSLDGNIILEDGTLKI